MNPQGRACCQTSAKVSCGLSGNKIELGKRAPAWNFVSNEEQQAGERSREQVLGGEAEGVGAV